MDCPHADLPACKLRSRQVIQAKPLRAGTLSNFEDGGIRGLRDLGRHALLMSARSMPTMQWTCNCSALCLVSDCHVQGASITNWALPVPSLMLFVP